MEVPFRVHHPIWVEDPDFDLDYHIRRIGAPSPGGRRELGEVAGQVASTQLDRSRPLWELWVVEGLKHDRVGIVTKVHHSAIDGASGAELMVHLFDLEPVVRRPRPARARSPTASRPTLELLGYADDVAACGATSGWSRSLGSTVKSVNRVVQGRRAPEHNVGAVPLTAPRTPWNGGARATGARSASPACRSTT